MARSMGQKLNGGGRERALQVPDFHFKICNLGPKLAFFFWPNLPYILLKTAKFWEIVATPHMQLDFPVPKGPLGPSGSTICLRTAPRRPPKALEFVHIGRRQPQTTNSPYLGLQGSKRDFECT